MPSGRTRSRSPHDSHRRHESDPKRKRREDSRSPTRHSKHKSTRDRSRERDDKRKNDRDRSSERKRRKEEKKRLREEEEARQVAELSVYSATDNPFHDANLGQQFKWHKKAEKEKKAGLSLAEAQHRDALRRQEAKEELERLNKRRAEREVEQQLREEEDARMHRLAESAQMAEWIAKDGDFQLEQERRRAAIRLMEKRAKAIDFLALNLKYASPLEEQDDELDDTGLEIDLDEPYTIFENLTYDQMEELHDDIERYLALEQKEVNIDFWTNMMVICKNRLESLRAIRYGEKDPIKSVEKSVSAILDGKSYEQLSELQRQIHAKLTSGEPVDVEYWEGLLKNLLVQKAKAKLKLLHEVVVRNRLEQLRKRQRDEAYEAQKELLAGASRNSKIIPIEEQVSPAKIVEKIEEDEIVEEYDPSMSPKPMAYSHLHYEDRQLPIVKAEDELKALLELRRSVAASRFIPKTVSSAAAVAAAATTVASQQPPASAEAPTAAELSSMPDMASDALYSAEVDLDMEEEEEAFNLEENISHPTSYNWEDKWRPRKPRYFNRVHTGYEWNKYNQTHYDTDNPPPKVVQGYKFNIFYPDLIDKSKAPTYKIVKEPGNEDTVLLQFSAGPPYEDIAFRIVNHDWEYSHKRGFRSSFDRGCLSLWFNFRRNFYRK